MLGRALSELSRGEWPQIEPHYRGVLDEVVPVTFEGEGLTGLDVGPPSYWLFTLFPVLDGPDLTGIGCALVDISARRQLEEANDSLVRTVTAALAAASEIRDPYTAGHQARVADIATQIARELSLNINEQRDIHLAAAVHDVGKIRTPTDILTRPGHLTAGKRVLVREHARSGYDILNSVEFPPHLSCLVLEHHERLHGSGYSSGLRDGEIRLGAKIIAIADVFDAMTTNRPYRPALDVTKAIDEISEGAGKTYDADAAAACLRLYRSGRILTGT